MPVYAKSDNLILRKKATISVTEAARNFADCVNRVHYQKVSYVLLKNGTPFARIVPESEKVCSGQELAEVLEGAALSAVEAKAWGRDLRAARRALKPPGNRWR